MSMLLRPVSCNLMMDNGAKQQATEVEITRVRSKTRNMASALLTHRTLQAVHPVHLMHN